MSRTSKLYIYFNLLLMLNLLKILRLKYIEFPATDVIFHLNLSEEIRSFVVYLRFLK